MRGSVHRGSTILVLTVVCCTGVSLGDAHPQPKATDHPLVQE